jgi:hypothetical protein
VFGMMAFDFTGGRGISDASTAGRVDAWYAGLQMFKSAPLFGIGFGRFADSYERTAHNSFVLCLAELGIVGSTILVALFTSTLMSLNKIINTQEQSPTMDQSKGEMEFESQPTLSESQAHPTDSENASAIAPPSYIGVEAVGDSALIQPNKNWPSPSYELQPETGAIPPVQIEAEIEAGQEDELRPFAAAMRLALLTFVATSFFLSRSYVATIYLILGLAAATIAIEQPATHPADKRHWAYYSFAFEALAILSVYLIIRFRF